MSSFDVLESGQEGSRPIELYEFVLGVDQFRFTSAEDIITIGTDVYEPEAIARSRIEQGADQNNRTITVTVPTPNTLAQKYVTVPPGEKATLNIFRFQRDEVPSFNTQVLLFKGLVQGCRFPNDGESAEFAVRSVETALNRNVPRFTFMSMCNHVLFDAACGAIADNFDHLGVATSTSGTTVTISGVAASGIDFVGGYVRPTALNDFRMVLAQSGDVLTLLLPFAEDPAGNNMQAFAGCDHLLLGDCALVFDRIADYGGFAFVPSKNIFASGLD